MIVVRAHGVFIRFAALRLDFIVVGVGFIFVFLLFFFFVLDLVEHVVEGSVLQGKLADEVIDFVMSLVALFHLILILF